MKINKKKNQQKNGKTNLKRFIYLIFLKNGILSINTFNNFLIKANLIEKYKII